MTKQEAIEFLKKDHQKLKEVIDSLSPRQMMEVPVFEKWTVKDILAHISAWNRKEIEDVDNLVAGEKPWLIGANEDEFNKKEIEKRKSLSLGKVLEEWRDSFAALIERVESLSPEEWNLETDYTWSNGTPLTMESLFDYEYEGAGHEGGHAKQIRDKFNALSS